MLAVCLGATACGGGGGTGGAGGGGSAGWQPTAAGAPTLLSECSLDALPGWDPQSPWPLIIAAVRPNGHLVKFWASVGDSTKRPLCDSDGTQYVYGWKPGADGPAVALDVKMAITGSTAIGTIPGWDPSAPEPLIALEHYPDATEARWETPSGYQVADDGTFTIVPSYPVDRVIVWRFTQKPDLVWQPSAKLAWKPGAPPPLLGFGFTGPAGDTHAFLSSSDLDVAPDGTASSVAYPLDHVWSW